MFANPIVASYCSTFLEPEERHLQRQVTGLGTFDAVVVCKNRANEEWFPFEKVHLFRPVRIGAFRRFWLKFMRGAPPVVYRGEYPAFTGIYDSVSFELLHLDSCRSGVDLLPILQRWPHPVMVSVRNGDLRIYPGEPDYPDKLRTLLRLVSLVTIPSEHFRERLISIGCPEAKIRVVPGSIPADEFPFCERSDPPAGALHLVQAGLLDERRGVDMTLRVFARLLRDCPDSSLTIAGRGPQEGDLRRMARDLGIEQRVRFTGVLHPEGLYDLFCSSHVFVQPSRTPNDGEQEAASNSLLEAMSTGLPVLATNHGGIPEVVSDGETGLLSAENDEDALHANLLRLINRVEERRAMERAAARRIRERFDLGHGIGALEAAYREAIS